MTISSGKPWQIQPGIGRLAGRGQMWPGCKFGGVHHWWPHVELKLLPGLFDEDTRRPAALDGGNGIAQVA